MTTETRSRVSWALGVLVLIALVAIVLVVVLASNTGGGPGGY